MEYKQVKYIIEENKKLQATIEAQAVEIERLKADMQEIIDLSYAAFPIANMRYVAEHALGQPEPPQESLTPAELGELAGKAEAVEEPLRVRVLRVLSSQWQTFEELVSYIDDFSHPVIRTALSDLEENNLVSRDDWKIYKITAAGRDYLASLDKPEPTDAEIDAHINEQERLHLESFDYGSDDNSIDIYPDEDYGDWGGGGLFD